MHPSILIPLTPSPMSMRTLPSSMITDSNSVAENVYAPIVLTVAGSIISAATGHLKNACNLVMYHYSKVSIVEYMRSIKQSKGY